ncbi:MAG: sigma-70 family RNA polymerase sigma factor [Gemmatimonadetes bacterium]|nr:sigma-70 family RNA polymerase sigma factor [Gemmatimonadota bacterium]NNK61748.1 sigma-70 family RNA polymerase sigma factor [Gemmatimonadota bacterium]
MDSDATLVDEARRGDPAAQNRLVSLHHEIAFRVARGIVQDDDLAADAVQDAFMKAFQALDRFRGDARFRTWLLSIVVNEARGTLRSRKRRRESDLDAVGPVVDPARPIDDGVVVRAEARRARALVDDLPEKQRMAVTLRIDEGLSFREIGALIGSSEGAARVNYHHGIRRLREKMSE